MSPFSWIDLIGLILLPIIGFVIYWLRGLQKDITDHKLNVAENYVKKDDLTAALNKIERVLEKIFEKLDNLPMRRKKENSDDSEAD